MICEVMLFSNGMVMVFDEHGQQMPKYQGRVVEVREKILRDAPDHAQFSTGVYQQSINRISRDQFMKALQPSWVE